MHAGPGLHTSDRSQQVKVCAAWHAAVTSHDVHAPACCSYIFVGVPRLDIGTAAWPAQPVQLPTNLVRALLPAGSMCVCVCGCGMWASVKA